MEESGFCAAADGETSDCAEEYFAATQFVNRCLSGRKVSRVSVTEGARGTENGKKPRFCLPVDFGFYFLFQTFGDRFEFENVGCKLPSKSERKRRTRVSRSPSVAFGASSLSEGAYDCACLPLCRIEFFRLFFGAFQTSPSGTP